jgi:hypothetical protein
VTTHRESLSAALPAVTSRQLEKLGDIGHAYRDRRWFLSFFAEDGDPDLYVQDLDADESYKIAPDGRWAYLGRGE